MGENWQRCRLQEPQVCFAAGLGQHLDKGCLAGCPEGHLATLVIDLNDGFGCCEVDQLSVEIVNVLHLKDRDERCDFFAGCC